MDKKFYKILLIKKFLQNFMNKKFLYYYEIELTKFY